MSQDSLTQEMVLNIFRQAGVMREGHFKLTSGRHSDRYMQCAHIYEHPKYAVLITALLAEQFKGEKVDVVIGPAVGGIVIAYELARQIGVRTIFAERVDGKITFRRGFSINPGENVVIAEDVITTGGSVREVIELAKECGAEVVGVAVAVDRSNGTVDFGVPLKSAVSMEVVSWEEKDCPLCAKKLPIDQPGSRGLR